MQRDCPKQYTATANTNDSDVDDESILEDESDNKEINNENIKENANNDCDDVEVNKNIGSFYYNVVAVRKR